MASIRTRKTVAGTTTHSVLFRVNGMQTSETFATAKAAKQFKSLVEILGGERARAELGARDDEPYTVDQLAQAFFDWKEGNVDDRTIKDYRAIYANWIAPQIGHRRANAVDERDVQALVDHMSSTGLDAKSVADRHMILHSMYRFGSAKVRRLVDHNPCLETQLPKRTKKPPKGVTLTEWQALYEAAQRVDKDAADLMFFIAGTGWRWSEAAALTVRKVEEYPDKDGVERMWVTMSGVMRQAQVVEGAAKSRAGIRRLKLPASVAAVIRRRIVGLGPDDLVFTNGSGRKWYQQNFLNRTWTRVVEASGLEWRPTPHFLRHTHVALLDRAGASLPEIQRRIGHDDIGTTINVYGGMIDDISGEALDALDRLLTADQPVVGEVVRGDVVRGELG